MKEYKDSGIWVSEDGMSFENKRFNRIVNGCVLGSGYRVISLPRVNGKKKTELAHRMVAWCYVPNPDGKPWINHKDGNKLNNNPSNLEWCTPRENSAHAVENGLYCSGVDVYNSVFDEKDLLKLVELYKLGCSPMGIADKMGCDSNAVWGVIKGKSYKRDVDRLFGGDLSRDFGAKRSNYKKSEYQIGAEWSAKTKDGQDVLIRLDGINEFNNEVWKWYCDARVGWTTTLESCKTIAPKIEGRWTRVKNECYEHDKLIDKAILMFNEIKWTKDALGYVRKVITKECFEKHGLKSGNGYDYKSGDSVYVACVIRKMGYKISLGHNMYVYKKDENGKIFRDSSLEFLL